MKQYHVWTHNIEKKLIRLKDFKKKVIIFAAEEWELPSLSPRVKSRLENIDITWIFGGADYNFYKKYPGKILLWHNFYMYDTILKLDENSYNKSYDIRKIFISMNRKGHLHRCMLMDMLEKHSMIDSGYISWRGIEIEKYKFAHWSPTKLEFNDGFLTTNSCSTLPREYSHSLINLISESTTSTMFVTEKTYHAILSEKPFLIQGPVGVHRYLVNQGFELYNEIFDYEFDCVSDDLLRTEMIVKNIKSLKEKDLNLLSRTLSKKAEKNKKTAIKIIKNRSNIPAEAYYFPLYARIINNSTEKAAELSVTQS